jgi:hypothetical protein
MGIDLFAGAYAAKRRFRGSHSAFEKSKSQTELWLCPHARSNNATDSACEVCGNMSMTPAPRKR